MPTENHKLNTPQKGETDWDVPLNENTADLDTLVEIRDTDTSRNDYTPKDGAKFLATDTGEVYLGDGDAWNHLGGIANSGVFHARSYGGEVGGEQIQAALDDAATADSSVVVVSGDGPDDVSDRANATRPNAWLLRSALEVPSGTTLRFRGAHVFLDAGVDQNLVRNAAATSGNGTRDTDIHVRGDRATFLNGNATEQSRPTTDEPQTEPGALEHFGILLHKVDRCSVSGFQIGKTAGWGVVVQDFTDCVIRDINFRQDAAVWNQDGCSFVGPGNRGRIEGITGTFGDDFATIYCDTDWLNDPVGPGGDVSNVAVTNCNVSPAPDATVNPGVRLQTGKATTVSDVTFSDLGLNGGFFKLVNSNDPASYSDIQNISINNVTSAGAGGGLSVAGRVQHVSVSNFHVSDSTDTFFYVDWSINTPTLASARHVTFENCAIESDAPILYTGPNGGDLEDITFRDVTYTTANGGDGRGARVLFYNSRTGRDITFDNVRIDGDPSFEGFYAKPEYTLENVRADNLHITNVTDAVSIQSSAVTPPVKFTNVSVGNCSGKKFDVVPSGVITNGVGRESANAETPTAANWETGTVVEFTDTGDGSATGVYLRLPAGGWAQIDGT